MDAALPQSMLIGLMATAAAANVADDVVVVVVLLLLLVACLTSGESSMNASVFFRSSNAIRVCVQAICKCIKKDWRNTHADIEERTH